jgi:hypothetical protein
VFDNNRFKTKEMNIQIPSDWDTVIVNTTVESKRDDIATQKRKRVHSDDTNNENNNKTTKQHSSKKNKVDNTLCHAEMNKSENIKANMKNILKQTHKDVIVGGINIGIESSCDSTRNNIEKMETIISKNLLSIISNTNYKNVLCGVGDESLVYTNDIKVVSKIYEETYLRQKIAEDEHQCVQKNECECMFIDPTQPFIGVQYKLPWDSIKMDRRGMCLLCLRATTQALFYDIMYSGKKINGLIQKYYNAHSIEGEYKLTAMLFCPPNGPIDNLPMPIVRHQRNFYEVCKSNGIFYIKQIGLDFQIAPHT